jgi:hypothetical protein
MQQTPPCEIPTCTSDKGRVLFVKNKPARRYHARSMFHSLRAFPVSCLHVSTRVEKSLDGADCISGLVPMQWSQVFGTKHGFMPSASCTLNGPAIKHRPHAASCCCTNGMDYHCTLPVYTTHSHMLKPTLALRAQCSTLAKQTRSQHHQHTDVDYGSNTGCPYVLTFCWMPP